MKYAKAIYAAALAALGTTQVAYTAGGGHIGVAAGITIGLATLTSLGVVFGVSNSKDAPAPAAE
jgi:hypothetical protein